MHPTAALLLWLSAVLATQSLSYGALGGFAALIFLSTPGAFQPCLRFLRRGRWLFLSLWLILAYGKPGEAAGDFSWAPTLEGIAEANLQAMRLVIMLACLAWLFTRLGREGLVSALWGLLRPLAAFGMDTERLVVRLSLVLEHLQNPLPSGAWKKMLILENLPSERQQTLHLASPAWTTKDSSCVAGAAIFLLGCVLL